MASIRERRAEHRAARAELSDAYQDALRNHNGEETPRWIAANERAADTARNLSPLLRVDIDQR